ncbi:Hairy/enhancer-of-split related with YRPW motif protein 2 [Camelus dromedarius]|uniref:Hairy/enhancer-of-split related with YRPW motif protein 2 n=1 Tax=Camelus dromedarius TaxID=9838 RepID=A0A5N4DW96_CAMDR|nr:Hairy/enhancer-of-split related with YRPW motif protein 2 [Camelus dromedarius]
MKRPCEENDLESDMDETIDVGSENNYSGQSTSSVIRSIPTTTSQIMARKKGEGLCKVRKSRNMQMTVDHLECSRQPGVKMAILLRTCKNIALTITIFFLVLVGEVPGKYMDRTIPARASDVLNGEEKAVTEFS